MNGISNLLLILNVRFYIFIIYLQYIKHLFYLHFPLIAGHLCWFYHIFDLHFCYALSVSKITLEFSHLISKTFNAESRQLDRFRLNQCHYPVHYEEFMMKLLLIVYRLYMRVWLLQNSSKKYILISSQIPFGSYVWVKAKKGKKFGSLAWSIFLQLPFGMNASPNINFFFLWWTPLVFLQKTVEIIGDVYILSKLVF